MIQMQKFLFKPLADYAVLHKMLTKAHNIKPNIGNGESRHRYQWQRRCGLDHRVDNTAVITVYLHKNRAVANL